MHLIDNIYHIGVNYHKNTNPMHDLKANFDKILPIVKQSLADQLDAFGNLHHYPNKPDLPDSHVIALSLLQQALSIDSEHWYWSKLQTDYAQAFPDLPHLTNYNRRRNYLTGFTVQLASVWGQALCPDEDTYIVDSIPISIAHIAREHSTTACRESFHSAPDKGYCASLDDYYIGYKLHLVVSLDGVYHSMEMTKASVHDVQYLNELHHSGLQDCLVLADKGYLSAHRQLDLFCQTGIEVQTPMRRNQHGYRPWPTVFKNARRRVETVFSQLSDQMMLKRNYAKSFNGLRARIIAKVTSVTFLQYLNKQNDRPLNHIKHALAA
ncbi:MAG: IS982 family transposase [Balneolaceae bacterium]|nr:MAG: IS982 family transposase [Balneolaceae bacterium]